MQTYRRNAARRYSPTLQGKQLKDNDSLDVIHLERTECDVIEEPKMAFEFLELQRQEQEQQQLREHRERREHRGQQERGRRGEHGARKLTGPILDENYMQFRQYIRTLGYKVGDLFYTSGVYAFKAGCDLPSVAAIIGYDRAIKLFQETEVENDYFDDLYGG